MRHLIRLTIVVGVASGSWSASAAEAIVATASNFLTIARSLEQTFEATTGHDITLAAGSTGKLFAQITQGAPYDVFLAADSVRPSTLQAMGHAVAGSRFTYATGQLVLWSRDERRILAGRAALEPDRYSRLAIAHPDLAPYGMAARQALKKMGLWRAVSDRLVFGENIGQTFTFVATRNAELGFVAVSQVINLDERESGSRWLVPQALYEPIRQDAVLLTHGVDNEAATGFLHYLQSPVARASIRSAGYGTP